jgi:hypothetical protein
MYILGVNVMGRKPRTPAKFRMRIEGFHTIPPPELLTFHKRRSSKVKK